MSRLSRVVLSACAAVSLAAISSIYMAAPATAQQAANMTFFVTSTPIGNGGNLGGLVRVRIARRDQVAKAHQPGSGSRHEHHAVFRADEPLPHRHAGRNIETVQKLVRQNPPVAHLPTGYLDLSDPPAVREDGASDLNHGMKPRISFSISTAERNSMMSG